LSDDVYEEATEKDNIDSSTKPDARIEWCVGDAKTKLAKTVSLSQRYFLEKASKTKGPSQRQVQLAQRRNAEALLGLPYFLVGQTLACNFLLQKLLSHLIAPSKRPLVLVFAGPSGHGKTELARKMGHLLSLELEVVDCTIFNREIELFGPREPYVGSEKGSPLNNFLAKNEGQRCIVFLDEFEKTTPDIWKTLLLPFDNGMIERA
jgi:ATP-dependent Clp protease ATP-binding subunit ClpA